MAKFVCSVCGYVHEGDEAPEKCPVCGVSADKFNKVDEGEKTWAAEHVVGVAQGVSEDIDVYKRQVPSCPSKRIVFPSLFAFLRNNATSAT